MGIFVTFEGTEGSGKSTVSKAVYEYFAQRGVHTMLTREPGGIGISESIRDLILDPKHITMDDKTEALLYAASRRQHLIEKIIPALEADKLVICDRFVDSSIAYQGYGRELGAQEVWDLNQFAIESYLPVLTLFLDVDLETGMERIQGREFLDRLEQEDMSFHQRVFDGYQKIVAENPDRIVRIDSNQPLDLVIDACITQIESLLQ